MPSDERNITMAENITENKAPTIDNSELEAAIYSFRQEMNPTDFNKALKLVQKAKLFCPASVKETTQAVEQEDGTVELAPKKDLTMFTLTNKEGKQYIGAFTSPMQARAANEDNKLPTGNLAVMGIKELYSFLVTSKGQIDGIVINPFSTSFVLTSQMVLSLGAAELYVPKQGEPVRITAFKGYPEGFLNKLIDTLNEDGRVKQMYIVMMEKENKTKSLLGIIDHDDMPASDRKPLFDKIARAFNDFSQGMHLMFVPYTDGFAQNAIKNAKPCYVRDEQ